MKTLVQIEPRTPISSVPFTITQPGSYYVTTNLTTTVSNAIVIKANGVTLDFSGFTISSTVANAAFGGSAILLTGGLSDITIYNGHIRSGVTNNGSGFYSGPGFSAGINFYGYQPLNAHVNGVSISGCLYYGISLGTGNNSVVEGCMVHTIGNLGSGISASTIKNCMAEDCAGAAIYGDQVADTSGQSTLGYGLYALTAQNCYGYSKTGTGLSAVTAQNCYGSSSSGTGLSAFIATSCHGTTTSGTALNVTHSLNTF